MNTKRFAVAALVTALAAFSFGCRDKAASPTPAAENDPRAKVLGVGGTGEPVKETPGTTSPVKSDVSKAQQANAMPLPGQANDHSTSSPKATQKPATTSTGGPSKP